MSRFADFFLNLVYPPRCLVCGKAVRGYEMLACPDCVKTLPFNRRYCRICGMPLDTIYGDESCISCRSGKRYTSAAAVPFVYKDDIRKAIIGFKFYRKTFLAKTFAAFIFIEMKRMNVTGDIISFVPIHFFRKGERGYNQSELIARELSKMADIRLQPLIKKTKHTRPLSKMNKKERREAVKGVYAPIKNISLCGERIILVDDVVTTGATTNECAKIIKSMGAGRINVCAVAATEGK